MNNQLQFLCIPHRTAPHLQSYEMCKSGGKPPTVKRRGGGGGGGERDSHPSCIFLLPSELNNEFQVDLLFNNI